MVLLQQLDCSTCHELRHVLLQLLNTESVVRIRWTAPLTVTTIDNYATTRRSLACFCFYLC